MVGLEGSTATAASTTTPFTAGEGSELATFVRSLRRMTILPFVGGSISLFRIVRGVSLDSGRDAATVGPVGILVAVPPVSVRSVVLAPSRLISSALGMMARVGVGVAVDIHWRSSAILLSTFCLDFTIGLGRLDRKA